MNEELEQQVVEEPDWKAQAEQLKRESDGRLRELREERIARQEAQSFANERLEQLRQTIITSQEPEPPPAPNPVEKPVEYLDHRISQTHQVVEQLQERWQEQERRAAEYQQQQAVVQQLDTLRNIGLQSAERIKAQSPDYENAVGFLVSRARDVAMAQGVPEANLPAYLLQQELGHNARCLREGKDPATEAYAMAQRWGYQSQSGTPQQVVAVTTSPRQPVARSLSSTGNSGTPRATGRLTAQQFAMLPHEQQVAIATDHSKFRQLGTHGYVDIG